MSRLKSRACTLGRLTKIENVASSAGVQPQRCVAGGAVLRIELLDVLVEAGLVRDMAARELQDALAAQGVLKRLLADGALAADESALTARARALEL